jgi:hypothetical protein
MGLLLLWMGRGQIREVLREAVGRKGKEGTEGERGERGNGRTGTLGTSEQEPLSYRAAVLGLVAGLGFITVWFGQGGMALGIAGLYLALLMCFVLVYARIRAEAGVAIDFIYPYGMPKHIIVQTFGINTLTRLGGPGTVVSLSVFYFLARFHFLEWSGAYQTDGLRLAGEGGIRLRRMAQVLVLALAVGFIWACWSHFTAYYQYGQNCIEGRSVEADWRTRVAVAEFQDLDRAVQSGGGPDWLRVKYAGVGLAATLALGIARRVFLRFPIHPLGFVLATAYGDYCPIWAPFLLIWAVKVLVTRLGGVQVYRKLLPFFLGLVIGHFFVGGFVWSTWSVFLDNDVAHRYYTVFG